MDLTCIVDELIHIQHMQKKFGQIKIQLYADNVLHLTFQEQQMFLVKTQTINHECDSVVNVSTMVPK